MESIDILSLASFEAIEIKPEDIESDTENFSEEPTELPPTKQELSEIASPLSMKRRLESIQPIQKNLLKSSQNLLLKTEELVDFTSKALQKSHSQLNGHSVTQEKIQNKEDEEAKFQYICNATEIVNIESTVTQCATKSSENKEYIQSLQDRFSLDLVVHPEELFEVVKMKGLEYGCVYCRYLSPIRQQVIYHIKDCHRVLDIFKQKKKKKQCPHCPTISTSIGVHILYNHTRPEDINWFQCGHCNFRTKVKLVLKRHIIANHIESRLNERFNCPQCEKTFLFTAALKRHIRLVHSTKTFKCDHCDYVGGNGQKLRNHNYRHHNLIPSGGLKCSKCDFLGKNFKHLISHQRGNHWTRIQCHLCPYSTTLAHNLNMHLIHHQDKKKEEDMNYKCKKCDYKTYRPNNIRVHMLKHKKPEELEMFQCYHCGFKAKRKDNLKSHIFRHDVYKNILDCFICNFKTRSKYELKKHLDMHSEKQRKGAKSNQSKGAKSNQRRESKSNQRKAPKSNQRKEIELTERKESISDQRKKAELNQRKESQPNQRKDAELNQRNEAQSNQRKKAESNKKKESESNQRRDAESNQKKESKSNQRKKAESNKKKEFESNQRRDAESNQKKESKSNQRKDAESNQGKEAKSNKRAVKRKRVDENKDTNNVKMKQTRIELFLLKKKVNKKPEHGD